MAVEGIHGVILNLNILKRLVIACSCESHMISQFYILFLNTLFEDWDKCL